MPGTPYLNLQTNDLAGIGTAFYTLLTAHAHVAQHQLLTPAHIHKATINQTLFFEGAS